MYIWNEEMEKLSSEIEPWREGATLKPNTPEKIKEKFEELKRLAKAERTRQINMMVG